MPLKQPGYETHTIAVAHANGGRVRCCGCNKLKWASHTIFGRLPEKPFDGPTHWCVKCAKRLEIVAYTVIPKKGEKG